MNCTDIPSDISLAKLYGSLERYNRTGQEAIPVLPELLSALDTGREWSGDRYVRTIAKRDALEMNDPLGKTLHSAQAAGFVRGIMEKAAEERYGGQKELSSIPVENTDRMIYRALLAQAYALGVRPGTEPVLSPESAQYVHGVVAAPYAVVSPDDAGSLKPLLAALSYARTLVRRGASADEVRKALNPIFSELLRNNGMLPACRQTSRDGEIRAWVAGELFSLFDVIADKKIRFDAEMEKMFEMFNDRAVKAIRSAA